MEDSAVRYYEFGEFRLDARKRLLLKNGENAQISPRIFDLLLVLVQNEGEILSHDDLLDQVWDGAFVEQSNLKKSISALRQILGEHPDERLYVQTVPRRGYSFVAPVRAVHAEPDAVYLRETHTEIIVEEIEEMEATAPLNAAVASQLSGKTVKKQIFGKYFVAAAVVILIAVAGVAVWKMRAGTGQQYSFDNVKITRLTSIGNADGATISPDGKYILYVSRHENGSILMLQQVATGQSNTITQPMKASFYFYGFTGDSEYVEYSVDNNPDPSQNGYFRVALLGGPATRLTTLPRVIAPDNLHASFTRSRDGGTEVVVANLDGSAERVITTLSSDYRIWSTKWSPDSSGVLLALRKFVPGNILHYVVEYPINGGPERIIVPEMEKQITSAVWLPDKSGLLLCLREINSEVRQIWQYTLATGQFTRVTNDNSSYTFLTISNDGRTLVTSAHDGFSSIMIGDSDKLDLRQVRVGAANVDCVGWTADGRLIFDSVVNKVESVFVVDADGSNQRPITKGEDGLWLVPRVSADGRSVLYASTRTGRKQLWRVDFDGRNEAYMTDYDDLQAMNGKLLSDGQSVLFQGYGLAPDGTLYYKRADGTRTKMTESDVDYWDVSPDESMIAYAAKDPQTHNGKIYVRRLDKSDILYSFDANVGRELRWTRDGKAITYMVISSEFSELYQQPVTGGSPKLLVRFNGERLFSFDWSRDGTKLAIAKGRDQSDAVMITNQEAKK